MKEVNKNTKRPFEILVWALIFILLALGVGSNVYYSAYPVQLRMIGWLVLIAVVTALSLYTQQGQRLKEFAYDAKSELQKVVWPSRQEAIRSTLSVIVMAVVVGFVLWLLDAILIWLIGQITI